MSAGVDTIVAPATASGRGGVAVLRLSGPDSHAIAGTICASELVPRQASYREFRDASGQIIDSGIAVYFRSPHSFTGEDVCELQCHGSPVVVDLLVQAACALGARPARAGEFSERAFLNGRMDLVQAEAIADLIEATSAQAARSALRSMQGVFSARVDALLQELIAIRSFVEAAIDFPEEEIDFLSDSNITSRIHDLITSVTQASAAAKQGAVLREGMHVVLAGRPNAGKSSLLNRLTGEETAIVSSSPGTTRDIVRENILIDGLTVHFADTAGLRDSADEIEREGIRRTLREVGKADRLLLVIDSNEGESSAELIAEHFQPLGYDIPPITVVLNKSDLSGLEPGHVPESSPPTYAVSALDGAGFPALLKHLKDCVGYSDSGADFSARPRHLAALDRTGAALMAAAQAGASGELMAEHLREAQVALGEITGAFGADDLLGHIFSSFCIGK